MNEKGPMESRTNDRFHSDYSKVLADALHESNANNSKKPDDVTTRDAYVALCYDDPRVSSSDSCRKLASALACATNDLALSERLVEGIRQASARADLSVGTRQDRNVDVAPNENATASLLEAVAAPAGAASYAELAFAAFVEIPLRCCHSTAKEDVEKALGSYRGPAVVSSGFRRGREEQVEELTRAEKPTEGEDNNIEEVWAEESDPSDFDYGPSGLEAQVDWSAWGDMVIDPSELSRPKTGDWVELQHAIENLLQELTYSKLSPLQERRWASLRLSDKLTQLVLTLLVESTNPIVESIRFLGIQPLNVLRDRAFEVKSGGLSDYLNVLQLLVAVDATQEHRKDLAPGNIVGLSHLSAVCRQANELKAAAEVRTAVLETCEELANIIDRSLEVYGEATDDCVKLALTIRPIMETLSNLSIDGIVVNSRISFSSKDGQWLLNSGLFRALVMFYTRTLNSSSTVTVQEARHQLLQAIEVLCLRCLPLLGKYAWRVPELSRIIQDPSFLESHVVDSILWCLMGTELCGQSLIRMKNTPVVTVSDCRKTITMGLELLFERVNNAASTLKKLRHNGSECKDSSWKEPVLEFSRLANILSSCNSLRRLWLSIVGRDFLDGLTLKLQTLLAQIPAPKAHDKAHTQKSGENDKAEDPLERPTASYKEEVASLHKSLKIITLSFADAEEGLSSKTD